MKNERQKTQKTLTPESVLPPRQVLGIIRGMAEKNVKNILVAIPTGDYAERLKLNGVLEYARDKAGARWNLRLCVGGAIRLPIPDDVRADGVIAYVQNERDRARLLALGRPVVLIEDLAEPRCRSRRKNVAAIVCDHVAEGRTAAEYFLARRYAHFAFVGTEPQVSWSELRRRGYSAELKKHGRGCSVFPPGGDLPAWLQALPKPCAVFAARDLRAREVLDAAEEIGAAVPQDLAVLGVDDDEMLCTTARPSLSSIPSFDRSLGYAAGRTLNAIMTGKSSGGQIRTRHSVVVTRQSTETDAVDDPFVRQALNWCRAHLDQSADVRTIAAGIGYSAPALQQRFKRSLGTTVSETMRHLRLSAAKDLLTGTRLSVEEIARRCGFSCTSHLAMRLREADGLTPLAYRRQNADA